MARGQDVVLDTRRHWHKQSAHTRVPHTSSIGLSTTSIQMGHSMWRYDCFLLTEGGGSYQPNRHIERAFCWSTRCVKLFLGPPTNIGSATTLTHRAIVVAVGQPWCNHLMGVPTLSFLDYTFGWVASESFRTFIPNTSIRARNFPTLRAFPVFELDSAGRVQLGALDSFLKLKLKVYINDFMLSVKC